MIEPEFIASQAKAWRDITDTVSSPGVRYANGGSVNSAASSASRTRLLIPWLSNLLRQYRIQTMLDVPCGDLIWMRHVDIRNLYSYIGMDLIPELIRTNQQEFHDRHNMAFRQANLLTVKRFPRVDLIMSRDFLYCLPTEAIYQVIQKFRESGSRYLLATNYPGADNVYEYDPDLYRWSGYMERPYDLRESPFSLDQIDYIDEIPAPKGVVSQPHSLTLFELNGA